MAREGQAKVLTESEFKRVLMVANNGQFAIRNVAMVHCSFGLGLRAKEIASLNISDVCGDDAQLFDEICLRRAMTKGEKLRYVYPTNKKVSQALQTHLDESMDKPKHNPLFETQRRSRFTPNVLQKWFAHLYEKAGIIGASSHSGRRTYITRMIEQGIDIKAVSRLAGHSSIVTTAIYVEDNPDRLKRIASLSIFKQ